jgi:hypothetical protein
LAIPWLGVRTLRSFWETCRKGKRLPQKKRHNLAVSGFLNAGQNRGITGRRKINVRATLAGRARLSEKKNEQLI